MSEFFSMTNEALQKLLACVLFRGFEKAELPELLEKLRAKEINRKKGEFFFHEGEPAERVGILLSGEAQVVRDDYDGSRSVLSDLKEGDIFGEVFACADVKNLPVSVEAIADSDALFLDCRGIVTNSERISPELSRLMSNLLFLTARKNLLLNRKIELLSKRTTREKLLAFLLMKAKESGSSRFRIPYDRQMLADYLGVERSAMCSELSRMRREGLIEYQKNDFSLLLPLHTQI